MTQRFTYFKPDGTSEVRTQPGAPLPATGDVYVRGAYEPPDYPSPLNVRVGKAGIKVWMIIQWLKLSGFEEDDVVARYGGALEHEDVQAALWFYRLNQEEIDERIQEEARVA
jgi:uncharacterized protein (DUF433 family)